MADSPSSGYWQPHKLTWWIATLFMSGAALFALGCALYLGGFTHEYTLDTVFFLGSLFFTSAAYCQLHQEILANRRKFTEQCQSVTKIFLRSAYWAALSQLIGTLFFNANTFDSYFDLDWIERELLVWTPNILGSILFQISGALAVYGTCKKCWCWHPHSLDWWINVINFTGCVAFLISAVLGYVPPQPDATIDAAAATTFTLVGACCFFVGAFLMLPVLAKGQA